MANHHVYTSKLAIIESAVNEIDGRTVTNTDIAATIQKEMEGFETHITTNTGAVATIQQDVKGVVRQAENNRLSLEAVKNHHWVIAIPNIEENRSRIDKLEARLLAFEVALENP